MNLPKKDKDGRPYLSYSQISLFKRDKQEYYERYILGREFEGNAYTDFGSKVGLALEFNNFSEFSEQEQKTLNKVTRLDEFERRVELKYDDFYIMGFVDTNTKDFTRIIDYKTGGNNKESQYKQGDYTQLCLYALAIRQETGITPTTAEICFIRRAGNAFRGEALTIANEPPILIKTDVTEKRLKKVYWDTLQTAKEIEEFNNTFS